MKDRLLGFGVLLLGIAAVGRVALTWIEFGQKSVRQAKQEELDRQDKLSRIEIIKTCSNGTSKALVEALAGGGAGSEQLYDWGYKVCLRAKGVEP